MQGSEYGDQSIRAAMASELEQRLQAAQEQGRPLNVYCGFDPTKADLHLGHTVPMRKLRQFQELGHSVTFLIGDFTALIGDPSDKDVTRPILTPEEVKRNAETYAEQAFRILDPEKTAIRCNSEWLSKLTFADLIRLASNFTVQQFLSREKFKLRWEKEDPIYLHETFYAVMQGYDAYSLKADVQIGGTDQFFNILTAARKIMTALGEQPNIAICLGILPGTDGEIKMSKSMGNYIPITTTAEDMFGKLMSIPDKAMPHYFRLVTRWNPAKIAAMEKDLQSGSLHPRDAKMALAFEVTDTFYGAQSAENAKQDFISRYVEGQAPQEVAEYKLQKGQSIVDVMVAAGLADSKSAAKRLIKQKGVRLGDAVIEDWDAPAQTGLLQVGKHKFIQIVT